MSLFSKLFGSKPPLPLEEEKDAEGARAKSLAPAEPSPTSPEAIATPKVMSPYVPPAARPTPTDVFERPTVTNLEPLPAGERPTVVTEAPPIVKAKPRAAPPPLPKKKPPPLPSPRPKAPPPLPEEDDLDLGFAAIERKSTRPPRPGTFEVDLLEVRKLFGQLATNHMRQVRDFIIELRWGATPTTWLSVCAPSIESLRRAADSLEFVELALALSKLEEAMRAIDATVTTTIGGAARERILAVHAELERILPETFALDGDKSQREAAILHALLSQIPDVRKVTIDKLYAAGLTTLETMLLATSDDIVATTGIPRLIAERIVERFHAYEKEMATAAIDETRAGERARIATLVARLRTENEEFERAAAAWTGEARQRKKEVLLARTQTVLAIDLHLARLGEVALVSELERLPFTRKVTRLEAFLADAQKTYGK